jgi:hypothetical protein
MQTPITLEALGAVVGILGAIIGVWWVVDDKINKVREKASSDVDEAHSRVNAISGELAAYKLHVAETYMSKISGGVAIDRNTAAVEAMTVSLKADINRVETTVMGRIERMENRVFNGTGPPHKA